MEKKEHIVSYTASEIDEMLSRGEDRTDWARVEALTDEEIEASIDFEDEGHFDLSTARATSGFPRFELPIVDAEVVTWFRKQGPDYQEKINAVLRSYIEAQDERKAS
jgi:uncharacterized protein (DUF4415 family)